VIVRNQLDDAFDRVRQEGRAALVPYLTAGFPEPETFVDLAVAVLDAGADALEIGIPFSDPLLDGPSIQHSQQAALAAGVTPADCLSYAAAIHGRSDKPLLFMGAYNPIFAYGVDRFGNAAAAAGVSGFINPDVPFEEQGELQAAGRANGLHLIQIVAPTSTRERLQRACAAASGFIYCISVRGVTGARRSVVDTAKPLVETVRACTDVPIAVGFGIAGPPQAREVAAFADGIIVGAALIDVIAQAPASRHRQAAEEFVRSLHAALQATTAP
jgi:tryptophan synthase alpha chain